MFCIKCGTKIPDESAFCFKCGTPVPKEAREAYMPQEQNPNQDIIEDNSDLDEDDPWAEQDPSTYLSDFDQDAVNDEEVDDRHLFEDYVPIDAPNSDTTLPQETISISERPLFTQEDYNSICANYIAVGGEKGLPRNVFLAAINEKKNDIEAILNKSFAIDNEGKVSCEFTFTANRHWISDPLKKMQEGNDFDILKKKIEKNLICAAHRINDLEEMKSNGFLPDKYDEVSSFVSPEKGVYIPVGFSSSEHSHSRCYNGCQEYKGFVYYLRHDGERADSYRYGDVKVELVRYEVKTGTCQVLNSIKWSGSSNIMYNWIMSNGKDSMYDGILLSVREDKVVFTDDNTIYISDLDGGNDSTFKLKGSSGEIRRVLSCVGNTIVYSKGDTYYKFTRGCQESERVYTAKDKHLTGYTSDKLIFDDDVVVDIISGERTSIKKMFPATKDKKIVLVSLERDVVYYWDGPILTAEEDCYEKGFYDSVRIIGVNKEGEIVDIWHLPHMTYDMWRSKAYSNLCFDGRRMAAKLTLPLEGNSGSRIDEFGDDILVLFDRFGNETHRHIMAENSNKSFFASYTCLSENMVMFMHRNGDECPCYNMIYDLVNKREVKISKFMD